jgi:sialic acid synthase SpsE
MASLQSMILQAKFGGADMAKVQLYDTQKLHGDLKREYLQVTKDELAEIKKYSDQMAMPLFASVFDEERLRWCEDLGFETYKIASRTVGDTKLCEAVIATGKPVLISLGNYPWREKGFPYKAKNIVYFYCVSNYPTQLEEVDMPDFGSDGLLGYSDHTVGIGACLYAVARGATYLEKHFTLNKASQHQTEKAHLGAMDVDELRQLRNLADDIAQLNFKGK